MFKWIKSFCTIIVIGNVICYEYVLYRTGYSSYADYIDRLSSKLVGQNILFCKFFQCISANNYLSPETTQCLMKYTSNTPYTSADIDYPAILQAANTYNIQLHADCKPINSGMISLIFRGHLRDTGEEVVIKILKNNIHTTLDYSCLNLYHIYLVFVVILYPFTNGVLLMVLKSLIKSSEYLTDQCNLTIEYENINRIRQELVKLPYFVVPVTYNKGESNFIVMDYLQGQLCDTLESETGVVYAKHLLSYTLYSVLYCSYMHLDLHLGNLIFMSRDDAPAIGIIDCGIMVHLDKDLKKSILCSLNLFYRSSTGKYGKMNVVKMANSIFEPPITHEMLGDKHDQLATIIMEYTDGIFAGVFNDKVLSETVLKISELTGNKCQFKIGIGRIFMGITILNRVILQFIKWDKKVYIGMLLDVLCELA